jgi:hypothetical protein
VKKLNSVPTLTDQGDGIRSFFNVLVSLVVGPATIRLIDEPEAFLHPPQARFLGTLIERERNKDDIVVISTHSGDLVRGLAENTSSDIQFVRLMRSANKTRYTAHVATSESIRSTFSDPIVSATNLLDGLFHDAVVLCESDADCIFYRAIWLANRSTFEGKLDLMFVPCGGKQNIQRAARALRAISVPCHAVCDIDILNDSVVVTQLLKSLGHDTSPPPQLAQLQKQVKELKATAATYEGALAATTAILDGKSGVLSKNDQEAIVATTKQDSGWSQLKRAGIAALPGGEATSVATTTIKWMRDHQIHVLDCGELESFNKDVGLHGPQWASQTITEDLTCAEKFGKAINFVKLVHSAISAHIESAILEQTERE